MGLMTCIIILFFVEVSILWINATQHENEFTPYIGKEHAVRFLKRHKRSASEECREGCYLEEMLEVFHNTERSHEYMTSYKCRKMSCSHGCDNTNDNFGHINYLQVACKVNGGWTSWNSWGECLVISTGHGQQTRNRYCTNPSPYNGGSSCSGSSSDSRACAINGGWTSWNPWGECLVISTGHGQQTRNRYCTNPSPYNGGSSCSGSSSDRRACEKQPTSPTVVCVVCQTTSATVLWKPEMNGSSTQTFFVKFWSPSQSSQATLTPAISDPGSDADVQHIINNLVPETSYIFQIIARNLFGDSLSKSVNCTTNERQYLTSPTSSDQSGLSTAGIACLIIGLLSIIFVVSLVVYWRFRLQKRTPMRNNDYTEFNTCNPKPVVTDQYDILNTTHMGTNDKSEKQTDRNIHTYEEYQPSNNTDRTYQDQTIQSTGATKKTEHIYDNMKI